MYGRAFRQVVIIGLLVSFSGFVSSVLYVQRVLKVWNKIKYYVLFFLYNWPQFFSIHFLWSLMSLFFNMLVKMFSSIGLWGFELQPTCNVWKWNLHPTLFSNVSSLSCCWWDVNCWINLFCFFRFAGVQKRVTRRVGEETNDFTFLKSLFLVCRRTCLLIWHGISFFSKFENQIFKKCLCTEYL